MLKKLTTLFLCPLIVAIAILFIYFWYKPYSSSEPLPKLLSKPLSPPKSTSLPNDLHLRAASFNDLPGWENTDTRTSLRAFLHSCQKLKQVDINRDRQFLAISAKELLPACQAALTIDASSPAATKAFFETWFNPYQFVDTKPLKGLFTGYYVATLNGSLTKTPQFSVPIYGLPTDLIKINLGLFNPAWKKHILYGRIIGHQVVPYPTRAAIERGEIAHTAPILAWTDSIIERLFLEIQGSGVLELGQGKQLFLNYAGQNGAKYTPVGRVLIDRGLMTKKEVSIQSIRTYLQKHPEQIKSVLNKNKSFVFFKVNSQANARGVHEIALTPGYSLAVDPTWIPIGIPVWLQTTYPQYQNTGNQHLQRLMVAQDVGGAIRGIVRGDVFWGGGMQAAEIAGKMKNQGTYWLLLPRASAQLLSQQAFTESGEG